MSEDNLEYCKNQIIQARTEIKNLRQQLSALKHEHLKEIKQIKSLLSALRCAACGDNAATLSSNNTQPSTSAAQDGISFRPIGFIETTFSNKRAVPRQPSLLADARGTVVIDQAVFNNPEHAMSGLEEFSHMWIIFHFHMTESNSVPAKVAPPRLGGERRGLFSTRSPHRPCPIGLSLVKIQSIEGNKIHFTGVDMVSGTPVLDIKPYIPQYDYPSPVYEEPPMTSLVRPPTEGISDAVEGSLANLQLDDVETRSVPNIANLDTAPSYDVPTQPRPDTNIDIIDGNFRSPIRNPDTERGAPDGQERFTPPQSTLNITHDGVRIAPWISNPPTQSYEVRFSDDALNRLTELIGDRAHAFKTNIESLLCDDPRSQYVRNRYPDHEYSCLLEDVSVTCIFDTTTLTCTIIAVQNAEELQRS